ncbi:Pheophorbide a oxygenase [Corchorus capsularis]|uniref:Pheophorbide a oxygenase n=1 Tax=Corchorus capsularis TaxID=210143 RepID=A0A1R3GQW7_COCAP|nr:Pheophorbide a oxygenase [Corchorus capsularis]
MVKHNSFIADNFSPLFYTGYGRRDRAKPLTFMVEYSGLRVFGGSNEGNPKISAKFVAPSYSMNKIEIDTKLSIVGEQKWKIWICSFNIPMAPGKTQLIVCSDRNFFQFRVPGPAWWQELEVYS